MEIPVPEEEAQTFTHPQRQVYKGITQMDPREPADR